MLIAKFSVLKHNPNPNRTEHVNIGVVVFLPDGEIRVRMAGNLRKLKAFDPTADIDTVRSQESSLSELLTRCKPHEREFITSLLGPWRLDGTTGTLSYQSLDELDNAISWALIQTCEPINLRRIVEGKPKSRLLTDLKKTFSSSGWLANEPEQINQKLVVHHYPLLPEAGIYADFAIRNGSLKVYETLDFRNISQPSTKRLEGQAKAMVLSLARDLDPNTETCTIIAGSTSAHAKETTKLLSRVTSQSFVFESKQDMDELFATIGRITGTPMLQIPT